MTMHRGKKINNRQYIRIHKRVIIKNEQFVKFETPGGLETS